MPETTEKIVVKELLFHPAVPTNQSEVGELQARKLIEIGAFKQVGVSEAKYLDDAMAVIGRYEYRLDLAEIGLNRLWVVDYRLSDEFLAEVCGINPYIDLSKCAVQDGVIIPERLAMAQGQWGVKFKGLSPKDALAQMHADLEEGAIIKEGTTAHLYYGDDLLRKCYMDFPRSRTENGSVPYLRLLGDKPELNNNNEDNANPKWGSVSRGSICLFFKGFNPTTQHLSYFMELFLHLQVFGLVDYFQIIS